MPPSSPSKLEFDGPLRRVQQRKRKLAASLAAALAAVTRSPVLTLWSLYLLLSPVYVFKSGLPQPADWLVVLLLPASMLRWDGRLPVRSKQVLRALAWFTGYVIVSALFWAIATGRWSLSLKYGFIFTPIFYLFNSLVFLIAMILHRRFGDLFLRTTLMATIASIWIQAVLMFLTTRVNLRDAGLFNNPNQLGYYALLSCTIVILLQARGGVRTLVGSLTLVAGAYLVTVSASKAALLGMAVLVGLTMFNRLRTVLLIGAIVGLFINFAAPVRDAIDRAQERIDNDSHQSLLLERGYDRIYNHPEYWLMGSGEGAYVRFEETTAIGALELHSSIGTMFFCYGILGSLVFVNFLLRVVRKSPWRQTLALIPSGAYGLVHQSLRFTLLWVLLAIVAISVADNRRK
jgi:hypothetical protein